MKVFLWSGMGAMALSVGYLAVLGALSLLPPALGGTAADTCLLVPEAGVVTIASPLGERSFAYGISDDALQVAFDRQVFTTEIRDGEVVDLVFRATR